jgi:hypothetical protein
MWMFPLAGRVVNENSLVNLGFLPSSFHARFCGETDSLLSDVFVVPFSWKDAAETHNRASFDIKGRWSTSTPGISDGCNAPLPLSAKSNEEESGYCERFMLNY